jgi:hypothetical protein
MCQGFQAGAALSFFCIPIHSLVFLAFFTLRQKKLGKEKTGGKDESIRILRRRSFVL